MLKSRQLGYTPIGLIDDDARKKNMRLHGSVCWRRWSCRGFWPTTAPMIIIAIPSGDGDVRQRIVNACRDAGVPVKTLPGVHELIAGDSTSRASSARYRSRTSSGARPSIWTSRRSPPTSPVRPCSSPARAARSARSSAVQVAALGAGRIVLLDHSENALVGIERELQRERNYTATVPALADVKDPDKVRRLFERHQPSVVFHARPTSTSRSWRRTRSSRCGTTSSARHLAELAAEHGVKRFVLVSTDKAVRPKNVLGQTRRSASGSSRRRRVGEQDEVHLRPLRQRPRLLGQRHPALPAADRAWWPRHGHAPGHGALLHDHPRGGAAHRPGGAIGDGDIFVLDMGKPVKIVDLAHNMIRLSGKEPGETSRSSSSACGRGRSSTRTCGRGRGVGVDTAPEDPPRDQRAGRSLWLEDELAELERLVENGETVEVVARLAELLRSPHRLGTTAAEAQAPTAAVSPPTFLIR